MGSGREYVRIAGQCTRSQRLRELSRPHASLVRRVMLVQRVNVGLCSYLFKATFPAQRTPLLFAATSATGGMRAESKCSVSVNVTLHSFVPKSDSERVTGLTAHHWLFLRWTLVRQFTAKWGWGNGLIPSVRTHADTWRRCKRPNAEHEIRSFIMCSNTVNLYAALESGLIQIFLANGQMGHLSLATMGQVWGPPPLEGPSTGTFGNRSAVRSARIKARNKDIFFLENHLCI